MATVASAKPTVRAPAAHLFLSEPLPQLLADLGAEIIDSSITDREFCGAAVRTADRGLVLVMPTGRDTAERECVARTLLARALGIDLPPLPAPFVTTVLGGQA